MIILSALILCPPLHYSAIMYIVFYFINPNQGTVPIFFHTRRSASVKYARIVVYHSRTRHRPLEQAQYEESLSVDYDTPHIHFRVPPLTLQPVVENAVQHGRDPYAGILHIFIRTRKTDSGSEIRIADNGRGFNFADDGSPHIALRNIRQRLEIMCNGTLTVTPNEGGGTLVTITIPDSAKIDKS